MYILLTIFRVFSRETNGSPFIRIITFSGRAAANYCSLKLQNSPSSGRCGKDHGAQSCIKWNQPLRSLPLSPRRHEREPGWLLCALSLDAGLSFLRLVPGAASGSFIVFRRNHDPPLMPADDHLPASSRNPAFSLRNLFRMHSTRRLRGFTAVGSLAVLRRRDVNCRGLNRESWDVWKLDNLGRRVYLRIYARFIRPSFKKNNDRRAY